VQHTLDVTQDNLKVARHSLKLSEDRQAEGVATRLDVAQASAQVASIEARLPSLEARRDDLINALSLLAAEPPRSLQAELLQGGELPAPQQKFAIGLPSELAERRPDIRQAEARLHAPPPASAWPRPTSTRASACRAVSASRPCSCPISVPGIRDVCLRAATVAADFRGWAAQGHAGTARSPAAGSGAELPQGGAGRLA
jgi:hypothetical protein